MPRSSRFAVLRCAECEKLLHSKPKALNPKLQVRKEGTPFTRKKNVATQPVALLGLGIWAWEFRLSGLRFRDYGLGVQG